MKTMSLSVKIQRVHPDAKIPVKVHDDDSGYDLFAVEDVLIPAGDRVLVPTGIRIAVPEGYEAQVRPKSGIALKKGVTVLNTPGTVDAGYRGDVGVILVNLGKTEVRIGKGEKVAQLVFQKVEHAVFESVDSLERSERGAGGFGSTGFR